MVACAGSERHEQVRAGKSPVASVRSPRNVHLGRVAAKAFENLATDGRHSLHFSEELHVFLCIRNDEAKPVDVLPLRQVSGQYSPCTSLRAAPTGQKHHRGSVWIAGTWMTNEVRASQGGLDLQDPSISVGGQYSGLPSPAPGC